MSFKFDIDNSRDLLIIPIVLVFVGAWFMFLAVQYKGILLTGGWYQLIAGVIVTCLSFLAFYFIESKRYYLGMGPERKMSRFPDVRFL